MRFSSFVFLSFFLVNLFFVSYFISLEPLTSLPQANNTTPSKPAQQSSTSGKQSLMCRS